MIETKLATIQLELRLWFVNVISLQAFNNSCCIVRMNKSLETCLRSNRNVHNDSHWIEFIDINREIPGINKSSLYSMNSACIQMHSRSLCYKNLRYQTELDELIPVICL